MIRFHHILYTMHLMNYMHLGVFCGNPHTKKSSHPLRHLITVQQHHTHKRSVLQAKLLQHRELK